MVKPLPDIDGLSPLVLKPLTLGLLEEIGRLSAENTTLRAEIARLKGLKGKPDIKPPIKPSGMDKSTDAGTGRKLSRSVFSDALFIALIDGLPTTASRMP